jgi:multisubunit Na+/H+ antiporter MnhB subunit
MTTTAFAGSSFAQSSIEPSYCPYAARSAPNGDSMKYILAAIATLGVALGIAAVIYGGHDDSPGLQLIGLVLVVGAVVFGVRAVRRSS